MNSEGASGSPSSTAGRQGPRPPPVIPDHEVLRKIGGGSYGEVWLVRNVMGTYRAVKVVYRDQFFESRPYEREFEGIRRFEPVSRSHPSQVNVLQVGRNDDAGYFYYVMELADDAREIPKAEGRRPKETQISNNKTESSPQPVRASGLGIPSDFGVRNSDLYIPHTLREELHRRGRLPFAQCLDVALALTTALKHLHSAGLIHRDIKPSNVIFVHGLPKLADIGLVAAAGEECSIVGTEGYLAPEGPGKAQGDIYSLGKVFYQMLTGLSPDRYPSLPEDWAGKADRRDKELNEVILKACEANVTRRYQSAEEMMLDLELLKAGKSLLRLRRLERAYRHTLVFSTATIAVVVVGGLALGFFIFRDRALEQSVRRELGEIQIARTRNPRDGWFPPGWSRLKTIFAKRPTDDVLQQASAMLAGVDTRTVNSWKGSGSAGAFGPDGRAIVSSFGTNAAMLIEKNGSKTNLPIVAQGPVCWPDDGPPLQLATVSNQLLVRYAPTGEPRRILKHMQESTRGSTPWPLSALAPDGRHAAAFLGSEVLVWSAETGALLSNILADATSLAFSPDGSKLGVGQADGTTLVCDVPDLRRTALLPIASRVSPVRAIAFVRDPLVRYAEAPDKDSWLVATAVEGADIVIWDLKRRQPREYCHGAIWSVNTLAFHPDGHILASAGHSECCIWDVARGTKLLRIATGVNQVRFITFDREGKRLLFGDESGASGETDDWTLGLRELEFGHGIYPLFGLKASPRKVWFSPNGRRLAALSDDWHVGIWSMDSNRLDRLLEVPVGVFADSAGGAFDSTGKRFAFATLTNACMFDLATGTTLWRWHLTNGFNDQLQFDPQARLLLLRREREASSANWLWRLCELIISNEPVLLLKQSETNWSAADMRFLGGAEQFVVWSDPPQSGIPQVFRAYEIASGREVWRTANTIPESGGGFCVDPRQQVFAYYDGPRSKRLRIFNSPSFREIGLSAVACDAIGSSGDQFILGDRKGREYLLPSDGGPIVSLLTDWTRLAFVSAFSPDGRFLASGTEEGIVLVANIPEVRRRLAGVRRGK